VKSCARLPGSWPPVNGRRSTVIGAPGAVPKRDFRLAVVFHGPYNAPPNADNRRSNTPQHMITLNGDQEQLARIIDLAQRAEKREKARRSVEPETSFYFLWNPAKSDPEVGEELRKAARLLAAGKGPVAGNWSAGGRTRKDFPPGSRFFMVRTGKKEPRGVIGYGWIPIGELWSSRHWDSQKPGQKTTYVDIEWEALIDPEQYPKKVVALKFLKESGFERSAWNPRRNGTELPAAAAAAAQLKARFDSVAVPAIKELRELEPDLEAKDLSGPEGRVLIKTHRVLERNQVLVKKKKEAVLEATGALACEACRFDFLKTYAELGRGFAECHHLTPLALLTESTQTRMEDLAIVCANCHRMLHRGKQRKTIAQLKDILLASPKPRR
jgi:HNH endonuclease